MRGGMGRGGPGVGQGMTGAMRGGLLPLLNDLEEAYKNNDREKMGEMIAEMKQQMERMRAGMGRAGFGGPPEGGAGGAGGGRRMGPGGAGGAERPMRPGGASTTERPAGPGQGRRGPGQGGPGGSLMASSPLPKTDAEKKILAVLDDMRKNPGGRMMNVPLEDGRLLRMLAESIGAKHVVEIGTSNGVSGIWLALALRKTGGKLTTHEIDATRASLARENFKRAGVDKIITLVEGDAHEAVTKIKEPIDLLFLDADKEGYIDYLQKLLPIVRPGGLIVAHNMNPRQADAKYIKAVTTNPDLETLLLHEQGAGVGVTLKKR